MILPFAHSVGSGTEAQCFHVHIHPHATTTRMKAVMADGTLKIDVAAAPEHGKANAALIRFLAKHFNVPRTNVEIVSGQTGRRKVVRVKSE